MKTFQVTRPKDNAQAIATVAKSKTAQQGADIRFIAGGTTLIDLMKLNVEQPQNLVDVNRLTLDKIEATPDGGLTIGATAQFRPGLAPARAQELPRSFRSDSERSNRADSQHGNNCRQPAATDALHVFPRSCNALQQA